VGQKSYIFDFPVTAWVAKKLFS